jgi:general secretion pathway protein K
LRREKTDTSLPLHRRLTEQRGIALLVTISVIAVLVPATLSLNRTVRDSAASTSAAKDRMTLSQMADSGIAAAMALLAAEKADSESDSLAEDWADPDRLDLLAESIPFERGSVAIRVSDERGRIQVNALVDSPKGGAFSEPQRLLWDHFLNNLILGNDFYEELDVPMVLNSLKDWLDSGDDDAVTGLSGAESDYYRGLSPPYSPRNGPIEHVDELRQVRGLDEGYLYGDGKVPGIAEFLTSFGISAESTPEALYAGRININTASLPVLAAMLPVESTDLADSIFQYRQAAVEDGLIDLFTDPQWYQDAPGCADLQINPALVTTASDLFRIEATAAIGNRRLTATAVVQRVRDPESGVWRAEILRREAK